LQRERELPSKPRQSPASGRQFNVCALYVLHSLGRGLRAGPLLQRLFKEQVHFRASLLRAQAVFHTSDQMERLPLWILSPLPVAGRQLRPHRQRYPQVRRPANSRAEELFWSDADDGVSDILNRDGLADRRRVGAELAFPPGVTYDCDRMSAGHLVIGVSDESS